MAGCCGGGSTGVVITGGDDISVTGSGTVNDPYVIRGTLDVALQARDTTTIALDLTGTGNTDDPFILSGVSLVKVGDLVDVVDPTPPVAGDALIWDGTKWTYATPAVAAGTVHAGPGLTGDGTIATPLKVKVSNTSDTALTGLYTYIDSVGELRVQIPAASSVDWANISNKPTTFPPTRPLAAEYVINGSSPGNNIRIFVGATTPSAAVNGDIWFQTP